MVLKRVYFLFFFFKNCLISIMFSLSSLPLELIQENLDHINLVKQLVQCRLVNRTFSGIGEHIILKKKTNHYQKHPQKQDNFINIYRINTSDATRLLTLISMLHIMIFIHYSSVCYNWLLNRQ